MVSLKMVLGALRREPGLVIYFLKHFGAFKPVVTFSGRVRGSLDRQRQGEGGSGLRQHQDVRPQLAQRPAAVLRRGRQPSGQARAVADGRGRNQIDQNLRRQKQKKERIRQIS